MQHFRLEIPHSGGELLLLEIVALLGAATLLGMAARRLGQSAILGYLLAGILLGPSVAGVVSRTDAFPLIAEIGVAMLLFTIGLELSWTALRHSPTFSLRAGLLQPIITVAVSWGVMRLAGMPDGAAIAVGMAVAVSSTAVVLRVLTDRAELDSSHGRIALSILLVQDLATVVFLLLLPQLGGAGITAASEAVLAGFAQLGLIVVGMVGIHRVFVRRLFQHASVGSERELLAILSLAIALGAACVSYLLGLTPALGAFIAGLLIGDTDYSDQVHAEVGPLRTTMIVLFFSWVGMRIDLGWVAGNLLTVAASVVVVVAVKGLLTAGVVMLTGRGWRQAVVVALTVAQLGEFSFVLAEEARRHRIITDDTFQLLVSVAVLSMAITPLMVSAAVRWSHRGLAREPQADRERRRGPRNHAIVVGYGPAGVQVVDALLDQGAPVTVIELNPKLRPATEGVTFVHGDGSRIEVLEAAGISNARLLVITVPEPMGSRRAVVQARSVAPDLPILARGRYHRFVDELVAAGATHVADEESLVGHAIAEQAGQLGRDR